MVKIVRILCYRHTLNQFLIFREDATLALAGFHADPLSWSGISSGDDSGSKTGVPGEKPSE